VETLGLDRVPEPEPFLGVVDVAEVVTGGLAVDAPELVYRLPRRGRTLRLSKKLRVRSSTESGSSLYLS
jgi:hypothetical protein